MKQAVKRPFHPQKNYSPRRVSFGMDWPANLARDASHGTGRTTDLPEVRCQHDFGAAFRRQGTDVAVRELRTRRSAEIGQSVWLDQGRVTAAEVTPRSAGTSSLEAALRLRSEALFAPVQASKNIPG